jgi:branched-chain amino acid transport system substrate-binding protein
VTTTAAPAPAAHAGQTITIGYVNDESGAIGAPEYRIGGEVAVAAINQAGGVAGAQIKLVHCAADGTPEGSINCANQFIEAKVDLVYAGIDVASDAFVPILKQAGIPYVSSNSWGPAQRDDDNSFMLHAAATAGTVAPLKFLKDEGVTKVALITQNTPVIQTFLDKIIRPIAEGKLGLQIDPILLDASSVDYAVAVGTAQANGDEGIWGAVGEAGCLGIATATNALAFQGPVVFYNCNTYIATLKDKAVGTYTAQDLWLPEAASAAPARIQANMKGYVDAMTAAGQTKYVNSSATVPYSALYELAAILATIPAGPIDSNAVKQAFASSSTSPGWLGPDLHCGQHPWPGERSHCRTDLMVYKVVSQGGQVVRQPFYPDFQDYAAVVR